MDRITTTEAAAIIGCSADHIRRLVLTGTLTGEKPSPRVLLLDRAEVEAYAAKEFPRGWQRGKPRPKRPAQQLVSEADHHPT